MSRNIGINKIIFSVIFVCCMIVSVFYAHDSAYAADPNAFVTTWKTDNA